MTSSHCALRWSRCAHYAYSYPAHARRTQLSVPSFILHHPSAQVHLAAIGKAEIKQQLAAAAK